MDDIIREADFPAALPRGSAKESLETVGFQDYYAAKPRVIPRGPAPR